MINIKSKIEESVRIIADKISIDLETAYNDFCYCNNLEPKDCVVVQYLPIESTITTNGMISFTSKYMLISRKDYESNFRVLR